MALVLLPSCVVVFDHKHTQGSLKAFAADGLSLGPLLQIWVFLVFLTVGFCFGFSVDVSFGCGLHVYFVVVFSARALGAGFRPGVFLPRFPPPRRWVALGGSFLRPYPLGCMLFLYLLLSPSASARNQI